MAIRHVSQREQFVAQSRNTVRQEADATVSSAEPRKRRTFGDADDFIGHRVPGRVKYAEAVLQVECHHSAAAPVEGIEDHDRRIFWPKKRFKLRPTPLQGLGNLAFSFCGAGTLECKLLFGLFVFRLRRCAHVGPCVLVEEQHVVPGLRKRPGVGSELRIQKRGNGC